MRLVKAPGTWELRVYIGRDAKGRVKHRYLRFHGTKREAGRELARLALSQFDDPVVVREERSQWNGQTTINDALLAWRENGWEALTNDHQPLSEHVEHPYPR